MKIFLGLSTGLFVVFGALAQEGDQFAQHKAEMLANIDKHISHLQENRNCVNAATSKEAVKKCQEANMAFHEEMKATHQAQQMEHLDQKAKKIEEQKAKLSQKIKK